MQFNFNFFYSRILLIILGQSFSNLIRGHADNRFRTCIVVGAASKNFDTQGPFLQGRIRIVDRMFDQIAKETNAALATFEDLMRKDSFELVKDRLTAIKL